MLFHFILIVFYVSPSDRTTFQLSMTFFSILANHDKALVWMISIRPLISNSSRHPFQTSRESSKQANYNWYAITLMFHRLVLFSGKVLVLFSFSFDFNSIVYQGGRVHSTEGSFYFSFFFC